mgnify:CR=1 FL=1
MNQEFINALVNGDLETIRTIEKSDLHNHGTRGGNRRTIEKWAKFKIEPPSAKFSNLTEMQDWYNAQIRPHCGGLEGYLKRIEAAFLQAKDDGISVLSMSFGIDEVGVFENRVEEMIRSISELHKGISPNVHFIPELALDRSRNVRESASALDAFFEHDYFRSIDIAGNEFGQPIEKFMGIYKRAKDMGLLRKAHVGEFGDATSIVEAVEALELQQIQHGIAAAQSNDVMKYL